MRVKETQPPASEGPASRAVALDKPLFQTHPLCTSVPPRRKMSQGVEKLKLFRRQKVIRERNVSESRLRATALFPRRKLDDNNYDLTEKPIILIRSIGLSPKQGY